MFARLSYPPWRALEGEGSAHMSEAKCGAMKSEAADRDATPPAVLPATLRVAVFASTFSLEGRVKKGSHRQRDRILHLAQRKARLDRGDAVEPGQLGLQERFVGREIGGDDAQQIVAVAGHQIAFQHLVPFRDRFCKAVEVFLLLPRQLDRDKHADMQA